MTYTLRRRWAAWLLVFGVMFAVAEKCGKPPFHDRWGMVPAAAATVENHAHSSFRASHIDTYNNATWYERRNVGPSSTIYVRAKLTFTSSSEGFVQLYVQNTGTYPRTVRTRLIATDYSLGKTWKDRTDVLPSNGGYLLWAPGVPCLSHSYHAGWRFIIDGGAYIDVNVWKTAAIRGTMEKISSGDQC